MRTRRRAVTFSQPIASGRTVSRAIRLILAALMFGPFVAAPKPAVAVNPPVNSIKPPDMPVADDATLRAEAAEMLTAILAASDIKGYAVLGAAHTARLNAHAAWTAPNKILGTLTVILGDTEILLKAMPSILTGRDSKKCGRAFSSDVLPDEAGTTASRLVTGCRDNPDAPIAAYYLGLPRKQGGIFVFGTLAVGNETAAKSADASLRAAVLRALPPH